MDEQHDQGVRQQIRQARSKFIAMAVAYSLGVFNDNFFRQAAILMAVTAGLRWVPPAGMILFGLPYLVFGAPVGWLADRFPKRSIAITAKALEVAAMVLGAVGICTGNWYLILAMVGTMGLQSAIFSPALCGSIPELYPASYVTAANAKLKVATTAAILLGMGSAGKALDVEGALIPGVPTGQLMVAGVVLAVAVLGFLASFGTPGRVAAAPHAPFPWKGPLSTLKELGRIRKDSLLSLTISLTVFIYFAGMLQILLINEMGIHQYGMTKSEVSNLIFVEMAGLAVGGVLSSLLARGRRWHRVLVPGVFGMAVAMVLIALVPLAPAGRQVGLLFVLLGVAGLLGGLVLVPSEAFVQVRAAPERKGAVLAAANFVTFAGIMLSGLVELWLISVLPPITCFAVAGAMTAAMGLLLYVRLPRSPVRRLDAFLVWLANRLLRLRYRIRLVGMDEVAERGTDGILFLPNHPALIDPVIMLATLHPDFRPLVWADQDQIDRTFIRWVAPRLGVKAVPDVSRYGTDSTESVSRAIGLCVEALSEGRCFQLYPSGHLYRSKFEDLRGNRGVHEILQRLPDVRVVLVRTRGLWGSSFGWAAGDAPSVARALGKGVGALLRSGIFFAPKRRVTIEFVEADDLPRTADRETLNNYLERFYNDGAEPNTYVPRSIWERGGVRQMPEPFVGVRAGAVESVPEATRRIVLDHLREAAGLSEVGPDDHLARDLGLDSLARVELVAWLEEEFGFPQGNAETLETVADVMLAACGEAVAGEPAELATVPAGWFAGMAETGRVAPAQGQTIPEAFLAAARRSPDRVIVADQAAGVRTYRDLVTAVLVLRRELAALRGERLGIMLPASVGAAAAYLSALFAGKTPVMLNWTVGPRNMLHGVELAGVQRVVTARALVEQLAKRGIDLSAIADRFVYLEDVARAVPRRRKLAAALRARLGWGALDAARVSPTAAILFTSGSESLPKAVPLTHGNILADCRDVCAHVTLSRAERMIGMLPPFHSFGLTVTTILPLCAGVPVVYHPKPTESGTLARLIRAYRVSMLVSTPTFLSGILRTSTPEQLATLRLVVSGAEKCPDRVYAALAERCPQAVVLEGYGVTECSPIISVNAERDPRPGTIGQVLPSLEHAVVDPEAGRRVANGERGMLLVRGPSVFGGYLGGEAASPFVGFEGRQWYRTGDLVTEDADGVLTFAGRLKRFTKLGGEMISLPAIESVLAEALSPDEQDGPAIAVEVAPHEGHPEIVLFTTLKVDRETANRHIRAAGLSALHNVRRVVRLPELPVLGTGKTDYRTLRERLEAERR